MIAHTFAQLARSVDMWAAKRGLMSLQWGRGRGCNSPQCVFWLDFWNCGKKGGRACGRWPVAGWLVGGEELAAERPSVCQEHASSASSAKKPAREWRYRTRPRVTGSWPMGGTPASGKAIPPSLRIQMRAGVARISSRKRTFPVRNLWRPKGFSRPGVGRGAFSIGPRCLRQPSISAPCRQRMR